MEIRCPYIHRGHTGCFDCVPSATCARDGTPLSMTRNLSRNRISRETTTKRLMLSFAPFVFFAVTIQRFGKRVPAAQGRKSVRPDRRSCRIASSSAMGSKSFGRPAARLSAISFSRLTQGSATPNAIFDSTKGSSAS